jgi:ABC-2 type transport system ATP-binding protein
LSGQEKQKRVDRLLERVDMDGARKRVLREYSRGMVQRIALAQALVNEPDLVLLDEPTSGLDPLGARDIRNLIMGLRKEGKTVFLCSHLLDEVQRMCDRVAILHRGRLLEVIEVKSLTQPLEEVFVNLVEGQA